MSQRLPSTTALHMLPVLPTIELVVVEVPPTSVVVEFDTVAPSFATIELFVELFELTELLVITELFERTEFLTLLEVEESTEFVTLVELRELTTLAASASATAVPAAQMPNATTVTRFLMVHAPMDTA